MARQDPATVGFASTRVHPMASVSTASGNGSTLQDTVWAEKTKPPGGSDTIVVPPVEPITCDSIGSCETLQQAMSERGESATTSAAATMANDHAKKEQFNIDFSNVNDFNTSSPTGKPMIENHDKGGLFPVLTAPYRRLDHPADKSLMLSFLISIFFLISALVLFGPVMGAVIVFLPFGFLLKRCMACCCCCYPTRACACCCSRVLSHADAHWLHDTSFNRMIMQSLITLEHGLDITRICDLVNARLVSAESKGGEKLYPRFTQKVVPLYSGYAWTGDSSFCMDNHIFPMPSTINNQNDLTQYISEMASKELSMERPLWEMHVLTNFGEDKDTLVLFRIHPCVSDGISLIRILFRSVVDSHTSCSLKPRFARGAFILNALRALVVGPLVFVQKWIFTRRDYNMMHGPELSGKKVVAWSEPFSLPSATRIKQVTRSTLNDVLLSVAAGCIRTYLQLRGVQNPYDMLVTIPIDLRSDGPTIKMGTEFILVDIPIPSNTEGAIPRLWEVKHRMDELKNSADPVVMYGSQWIMWNMLPECLCHRIWSTINNRTTCLISNLPGPDTALTFASREVKSILYWIPPRDEVAVSISFLTYADQVRMAVLVDQAAVPCPEIIVKDFIFQMEKLSTLLANRRIPGEHPGRRIEALHDDNDEHPEPSVEEIQMKMADVQVQLQELKSKLDTENQQSYSEEEQALVNKVEQLKEEFRELLLELRRKRMAEGSGVLSDDEDDSDGELRRSYRKRTLSGTSRRSIVSSTASTARPLTTSPPQTSVHQSPQSESRPHTPTSPTIPLAMERRGSEVTLSPKSEQQKSLLTDDQVVVVEAPPQVTYSPPVERKC